MTGYIVFSEEDATLIDFANYYVENRDGLLTALTAPAFLTIAAFCYTVGYASKALTYMQHPRFLGFSLAKKPLFLNDAFNNLQLFDTYKPLATIVSYTSGENGFSFHTLFSPSKPDQDISKESISRTTMKKLLEYRRQQLTEYVLSKKNETSRTASLSRHKLFDQRRQRSFADVDVEHIPSCPISKLPLTDPVKLSTDGQIYQREVIISWLKRHRSQSPHNGEKIPAEKTIEECLQEVDFVLKGQAPQPF